jgi:hypothetical protein
MPVIAGQMAANRLVQWSKEYCFKDFEYDLATHGAIIVARTTKFRRCNETE